MGADGGKPPKAIGTREGGGRGHDGWVAGQFFRHIDGNFRCFCESRAAPWVDTYLTGAIAVTAVYFLAQDAGGAEKLAATVVAVPAIPLGISAAWGHWNVSDCRSLHRFALAPATATDPAGGPTDTPGLVKPDTDVRFPGGDVRRMCRDREDFDRARDCVLAAPKATSWLSGPS